jgi:hypothetical protein
MKKTFVMFFLMLLATASFARDNDDSIVRWAGMAGVITADNVDNPVGNTIHSGTFPWRARSGHASVNLATGATSFDIQGLVISGSSFAGTPGPITAVTGTLVCDAGTRTESVFDTTPVPLNVRGNARFLGTLRNLPATCSNPLFLLRIANLEGANGLWIANGVERFIGDDGL